jgi:2-hydroxychromene-2-carboxylate isomerase
MMTTDTQPGEFTSIERAYIRSELDQFFSSFPTVADGIQLRTWRTGTRKDRPKLPPAAQSLLARDLVRLDTSGRLPRLFFTAAGLSALRQMFADKRLADPQKFAHVRRELGIDQRGWADAAE